MPWISMIRPAGLILCGLMMMAASGCGKSPVKSKVPSDRKVLLNLCWQTMELGMKDKNAFVQNHTMRLLGRIGSRRAVLTLQSADLRGKPTLVRMYVNTLGKIRDSLAFMALTDYSRTSDFQIRARVLTGLNNLSGLYDDSTMIRIYRRTFREVDSVVVDSLLYDSLATVIEKNELRAKIGVALLKYRLKDGLPYVQSAMKDPSFQMRLAVVNAFGDFQPEESVHYLKSFRKDPSDYVRSKTAEALGKIGSPDAAAALRDIMLTDPSESVRIAAAIELMRTDEGAALPAVMKGVHSYEDDIRGKAILALGDAKNSDAKEKIKTVILPLIEDPNEWIRIAVIGAIGKMNDTASAAVIEKSLESDPSQDVREIALSVLSRFRGIAMAGKLQSFLNDETYSMRSAAVSALGRIRNGKFTDQTVIPAVFDRMMNDQDMIVRIWAAFVLYDILNDYRITSADEKK